MPPLPIILFVYNRPQHTRRTLEALARNVGVSEAPLVVYSDGPKTERDVRLVEEVRSVCGQATGFGSVELISREQNLGLAGSIRQGVTEAVTATGAVCVLEDDLLTSPFFYRYLQGALTAYEEDERVMSVSAFVPPRMLLPRPKGFTADVWLSKRNLSFGWGVWADRWASVQWDLAEEEGLPLAENVQAEFAQGGADLPEMLKRQLEGTTDSWAIQFSYAHYRQGRYSVLPRESYVKPIGFDGSGVHCRPSPLAWFSSTKRAVSDPGFPSPLEVDPEMQDAFRRYYDRQFRGARLLGR